MTYYLKLISVFFAYMIAGGVIAVVIGYLCGATGGLLLTFYNNNFLADTAQGSYLWWAKFCGYLTAVFAAVPGIFAGFFYGSIQELRKNERNKKSAN